MVFGRRAAFQNRGRLFLARAYCLPLLAILGPRSQDDRPSRFLAATQRNARSKVSRWRQRVVKNAIDLSQAELVLDCDASASWSGQTTLFNPRFTRSRGQGMWLLSRGARMRADVCCRLQGLEADLLTRPSSDADLRKFMGNAMSMSVIEPVLCSAFIATGRCTSDFPARWESGVAQAALVMEAWGVALPEHLSCVAAACASPSWVTFSSCS